MENDRAPLRKGVSHFSSQGQLLAELGERLVATPVIALAELIKNAYDADSTKVNVWITERKGQTLTIKDDGHGMTEAEFLAFWMVVATGDKVGRQNSRIYKRALTGSKGVGRFAVRVLGSRLKLETVALDKKTGEYQRIEASFNWEEFKGEKPLEKIEIHYAVYGGLSESDRGTALVISGLHEEWNRERFSAVTRNLMTIVSPPLPPPAVSAGPGEADPGFSVFFASPGQETAEKAAGHQFLDRFQARVSIVVTDLSVQYNFEYAGGKDQKQEWALKENLVGNLTGEIRYYPRRAGLFKGLDEIDGRSATVWLKENGGVRVIDRGFRMPPYGEARDDWLELSASAAINEREWRSPITKSLYPEEKLSKEEVADPHLKLPANHQLLGAVRVASYRPLVTDPPKVRLARLQPAMDRQGFIQNAGFRQLQEIVRAALEILAVIDVDETAKRQRRALQMARKKVATDVGKAIAAVRANPEIPLKVRNELVRSYESLMKSVEAADAAEEGAERALESLYLVGILAAFMTHESNLILRDSKRLLTKLNEIPDSRIPSWMLQIREKVEQNVGRLERHLDYTRAFVRKLSDRDVSAFPVRGQIRLVMDQFEHVTFKHSIEVKIDVPAGTDSPKLNVAVYAGIITNLVSNALKAILILKGPPERRRIWIEAWSENDFHYVRVSDSGVGVPPTLRGILFRPLVSSTAGTAVEDVREETSLGPGMGLGLFIVRKLLKDNGGTIRLVEAPDGYSTCFEFRVAVAK